MCSDKLVAADACQRAAAHVARNSCHVSPAAKATAITNGGLPSAMGKLSDVTSHEQLGPFPPPVNA
jgi:hypothetical protein